VKNVAPRGGVLCAGGASQSLITPNPLALELTLLAVMRGGERSEEGRMGRSERIAPVQAPNHTASID